MTVLLGGAVGLPGLIGFGSSTQAVNVLGATIDISGENNYAFSMPRDGNITSLAVYLSVTLGVGLGDALTYTVQVYSSATPDDVFTPVPGAVVNLALPAVVTPGQTFDDVITGLSIPVSAGTRLLLVASLSGGPLTIAGSVTGYVSAGLGID
ncbi:MAG: hypothetical protein GX958_12260 [Desulfitobacterium sp.]|nr:hypothetical protein [Desulfitobacterium sp.]